jgi:hypothetical protein
VIRAAILLLIASALAFVLLVTVERLGPPTSRRGIAAAAERSGAPEFGDAFWKHWGDGRAEMAGYDLVTPRYGELRKGVAITVFVTETFSNSLRVKSDPGHHPKSDEFPVMKLNLVQDFPTGIYDYNLLTSSFVALAPVNGRPAGSVTKVSFSAQEWCGHVYSQLLFDRGSARHTLHSYFDGEADRQSRVDAPNEALDEDGLMFWARGLAAPLVDPGQSRIVPIVRSLRLARLAHEPVMIERAHLARSGATHAVTVPAGKFETRACTATIGTGRTWTFEVETAEPHRIIAWSRSDGEKAEMLGGERLAYWKMNGPQFLDSVEKLGLKPRGARMP